MSRSAADHGNGRWWVAACLLLLVVTHVWLLRGIFAAGEPVGNDLSAHLAESAHLARALRAGDLEWWNPGANLGYPSGYYYQVLPELLPALLDIATGGRVGILSIFKLCIVLPLALLPLSVYRALRVVGLDAAEALGGAFAVGFVFADSPWGLGADSMFTLGLYTQAWGALVFPLALANGYRYLAGGDGLFQAAGLSVLTGLCHPLLAVCLAPALAVCPWWWHPGAGLLRRGAALGGLVLLASSFFWLPVLMHYDSFGGFPTRFPAELGIPPSRLFRMLLGGQLLDRGRLPVLTVLLLGAVTAAWRRRSAAVGTLLAMGALFGTLLAAGPLIGAVREDLFPAVRMLLPMQLALGCAAGIGGVMVGVDLWRGGTAGAGQGPRTAALRAGIVLVAAAATAVVLHGSAGVLAFHARTVEAWLPAVRADLAAVIARLPAFPGGRMAADARYGTGSHWVMYLPFAYTGRPGLVGYGGAALQSSANYEFVRAADAITHARAFNVRYLLAHESNPAARRGLDVAFTAGAHRLLVLPAVGYFSPVRLVGAAPPDREGRRRAALAWLDSDAPADDRYLVVGGTPPPTGSGTGRVLQESETFSRYDARVEVTGTGPVAFLLRATYHPGWHAAVDGAPAPILRVIPDMMAILVPPGRHHLTFRFRRPWWTWVLLAVSVTALGVAGAAGVRARSERSHGDGPADGRVDTAPSRRDLVRTAG